MTTPEYLGLTALSSSLALGRLEFVNAGRLDEGFERISAAAATTPRTVT
jgi:hypothetical protein